MHLLYRLYAKLNEDEEAAKLYNRFVAQAETSDVSQGSGWEGFVQNTCAVTGIMIFNYFCAVSINVRSYTVSDPIYCVHVICLPCVTCLLTIMITYYSKRLA